MKFPIRIRLYPESTREFALVYIWPTPRQIRNSCRDTRFYTKKELDLSVGYTAKPVRSKLKKQGCFAVIHLCQDYLASGYLSHELNHATFFWFAKRGIPIVYTPTKLNVDIEEAFCYGQQHMLDQLRIRLAKLNLGPYTPDYA